MRILHAQIQGLGREEAERKALPAVGADPRPDVRRVWRTGRGRVHLRARGRRVQAPVRPRRRRLPRWMIAAAAQMATPILSQCSKYVP